MKKNLTLRLYSWYLSFYLSLYIDERIKIRPLGSLIPNDKKTIT
jgi:hypothetical protein